MQCWVGDGVDWWMSPLVFERGWCSPGRLMRGSESVPGFILGWVGVRWIGGWFGSETVSGFTPSWVGGGWVGGHSPWAERGL